MCVTGWTYNPYGGENYLRLQGPEFSIGTNYLIFAVDENADSILDATWWDYVEVNVE